MMTSSWRLVFVVALIWSAAVEAKKKEKPGDSPTAGRKGRGVWIGGDHKTGMDHGHGHGWMKLHNDRHHDHSTKLSEAYVKFHGLGEKGNMKGGGGRGILGRLGNVLNKLGIGRGDPEEEANSGWGQNGGNNNDNNNNGGNMAMSGGGGGWGSGGMSAMSSGMMMSGGGGWGGMGGGGMMMNGQEIVSVSMKGGRPMMSMSGGGGGGWGGSQQQQAPPMMQMQSGWGNPQMQMVVAQPTGWASANNQQMQQNQGNNGNNGGGKGGNGNQQQQTGWASGDFASYKPPKGGNNNSKGHFQLNIPTGKPAYIQKLKPIIDLPKIHLHGLGWR